MYQFNQQDNQQNNIQKNIYQPAYLPNALSSEQIKLIEELAKRYTEAPAMIGAGVEGVQNKEVRRSNISWLIPNELPKELQQLVEHMFLQVNAENYRFHLTGTEAFQYTVYDQSNMGEYKWHADTAPVDDQLVRKLSMSLLLSHENEYEGGKLILAPHGNPLVAEERQGRAVFFPSWVPHCVTPVTKGTRKSLVIWAHGPAFR